MLIGYARVSTLDQNLDLQKDALKKAGCERTFEDKESGAKALEALRPGDTLVLWKLDRLGRSLKHLVETVQALSQKGIGFKSLQESLDTTSSGGKLIFHIFAALAEFERDIIRERTQAGLVAARARGRQGGRPRGRDERKRAAAIALSQDRRRPVTQICQMLGISRTSFYRYTGSIAGASSHETEPKKPTADRNAAAAT